MFSLQNQNDLAWEQILIWNKLKNNSLRSSRYFD